MLDFAEQYFTSKEPRRPGDMWRRAMNLLGKVEELRPRVLSGEATMEEIREYRRLRSQLVNLY